MEDQNIRITLYVSEEQLDTINHLFSHYGWNYNEVNWGETDENLSYSFQNDRSHARNDAASQTASESEHDLEINEGFQDYNIPQVPEEDECMFCLCRPCITHERNRQLWWEQQNGAPHLRNSGLRKEKYQRFWTMMYHRDAWKDPRYLAEKLKALQADPRHRKYEWHRRDIMPKCVLSLVRTWFPNPDGVPYMGHLWE